MRIIGGEVMNGLAYVRLLDIKVNVIMEYKDGRLNLVTAYCYKNVTFRKIDYLAIKEILLDS